MLNFPLPHQSHDSSNLPATGALGSPLLRMAEWQKPVESKVATESDDFHTLVELVRAKTGAEGAAIAVSSETGELRCRASSGVAPAVGTCLDPGNGLTGLCLRRGQVLLCPDTDTEEKVDKVACQALGIRSVLALPLIQGSTVIGILELLASEPDSFKDCSVPELAQVINSGFATPSNPPTPLGQKPPDPHEAKTQTGAGDDGARHLLWARWLASAAVIVVAFAFVVRHHRSESRGHVQPRAYQASSRNRMSVGEVRGPVLLPLQKRHAAVEPSEVTQLRDAASRGDAKASYVLGTVYEQGSGVPQDYDQAMDWFLRAAAKGNANAQWKLGLGYLKAFGREEDDEKAAEWFKRAANRGNVAAEVDLSRLYLTGRGVPVDYVRAYTWARIATQQSRAGEQLVRSIEMLMTPEQIQDAHRRVSMWNQWSRHQIRKESERSRNSG